MLVWEYHVAEGEVNLKALGQHGWELVAVVPGATGNGHKFYFKRLANDFRDQVTAEQKRRYYARMGIALPDDKP